MDWYGGNDNGSGDEQEPSSNGRGKKSYHRHTSYQIQQLEAFFKECPHPDENQRRQLSRELGLEAKQIKFWFQNKRTQTKAQSERADNSSLRGENEKYQCENLAMKEALKNVYCPACGGPSYGEEERRLALQRLKMENVHLKQEYERISYLIPDFLGKPLGQLQSSQWSSDLPNQGILGEPSLGLDAGNSSNSSARYESNRSHLTGKSGMIDRAMHAMDELIRLLRVNEPLWIKSPIDGRYVIHPQSYSKLFPSPCHFKNSAPQVESSKDSSSVAMDPIELLNMLVDPDKWVNLFPTIVTKARTIEVLDTRQLGDHAGSLQLMYEQMHILSPLVGPREFYFLRYCGMVEPGVWVMVDVSHDWPDKDPHSPPLRSWKLPSGCLIQDEGNGCCKVTWVEHVELDERYQIHRLYRDLVYGCAAFGAQRWVSNLVRMSERLSYAAGARQPSNEPGGGTINKLEGRRSVMELSQRMVKDFCLMLSMSGKLDFPHVSSELSNSGIHVSVRQSGGEHGQPTGTIVSAAASLWLPVSCQALFNFFRDEKTRAQWDVLDNGSIPVASISCGVHPGNCVSITQPIVCHGNKLLMLQENCTDPSGSLVVFAPVDFESIKSAMEGGDSTNIHILPSGFVISTDGRPDKGKGFLGASTSSRNNGGSLLTVAFQILVSNVLQAEQVNSESVTTVNTLVSSTVQKIKTYFGCLDVDLA